MPVIDADTHIDETEDTWAYLEGAAVGFRPVTEPLPAPIPGDARPHLVWRIGNHLRLRRWRDDKRTGTTRETRELLDVEARLRHMDKLGVDIHVIYPTMFLSPATPDPEVEVALCRSYNRWLAEATSPGRGRLRWVAVVPMCNIDSAARELSFARDHGACGVLKRGLEYDRKASDPYFFPLYEEAERLNLPICVHTGGGGNGSFSEVTNLPPFPPIGNLSVLAAFSALVLDGVPKKFPRLRFGFIEAGASWIPYLITDLKAKSKRQTALGFDMTADLLRAYRLYVTADTIDDLPYLLRWGTEDSLLLGTDYSHADQSAELEAFEILRRRAATGEIAEELVEKVLNENPRRFYGL